MNKSLNFNDLISIIEKATANAEAKIKKLQGDSENISIGDMFEMQIVMNQLSQLTEVSTHIVAASNAAIRAIAQNINR